jgi:hypothetical protein
MWWVSVCHWRRVCSLLEVNWELTRIQIDGCRYNETGRVYAIQCHILHTTYPLHLTIVRTVMIHTYPDKSTRSKKTFISDQSLFCVENQGFSFFAVQSVCFVKSRDTGEAPPKNGLSNFFSRHQGLYNHIGAPHWSCTVTTMCTLVSFWWLFSGTGATFLHFTMTHTRNTWCGKMMTLLLQKFWRQNTCISFGQSPRRGDN